MKLFKILSLWGSQVLTVFFNLGVQLFLARLFTQEDVGTYFSLIALLNITATIGQFGLNKYLLIIFTKYKNISLKSKNNIIQLFLLLNFIGLIIYFLITYLLYDQNLIFALLISPLYFNNTLMPVYTTLIQVKSMYLHISTIKLLVPLFKVCSITVVGFLVGSNIFLLGLSIFILSAIFTIYLIVNIYNEIKTFLDVDVMPSDESKELESKLKTIKIMLPYALLNVTFMIYTQGNTFMLGALSNEKNVALFANAYLILNAIYIFPTVIYQKVLAHHIFSMLYEGKEKALSIIINNLNKVLIFVSSVIIVILYSFSEQIILILFGTAYRESIVIFQLLLIAIPFRLTTISIETIMSTDYFIKKRFYIEIVVSILNVTLNIFLISFLGLNGVIITVIVTEIVLAFSLSYYVDKKLSIPMKEKLIYLYLLLPYSYLFIEMNLIIILFVVISSILLGGYYIKKLIKIVRGREFNG